MLANEANQIVEGMLPYERDFFLWLNNSHNIFLDSFMWIYSNKMTWIPLAILAISVFAYKIKWKQTLLFFICIALLFTLCDQLSAGVIKPFFERYRPTHHPDFSDVVRTVNNYRGGRFGFISAHAANGFGIATFLSLIFKYKRFTISIFLWASVTAYSRVYLGVHFISDIIGGMLLGSIIGFLIYLLFQYFRITIIKQSVEELELRAYPRKRAVILYCAIFVMILSIIIISLLNFLYGYRWLY